MHGAAQLLVGDGAGDEILGEGKVAVVGPVAYDGVIGGEIHGEVFQKILLGLEGQGARRVELAVAEQERQPVEEPVFIPVQIEDGEASAIELIDVGKPSAIDGHRPFLREIERFRAIKPPPVIVVGFSGPVARVLDDVLRPVVQRLHHRDSPPLLLWEYSILNHHGKRPRQN